MQNVYFWLALVSAVPHTGALVNARNAWRRGLAFHAVRDGRGREMMMAMISIRSAGELAGVPDPAWPEWLELIRLAPVTVLVLPAARQAGLEMLFRLQVTARSPMGALALNSGGILVDHGWVRLLGGGSEGLPDLAAANGLGLPDASGPPPWLTAGFDVLGGRFAVNGGGLPGQPGEVCYWGPDTLAWTPLGGGYSQFARMVLGGGLARFYQDLRWPGWQEEVAALRADQGISVHPFLFTAQSHPIARASRRPVPFAELLGVHDEAERQVSRLPPGSPVRVTITGNPDSKDSQG
jgi:Protein of unknown function DUF2625